MKIQIQSTLTLNLSADDWQLYDLTGREEVARKLNHDLEQRINNASTRHQFRYGDLLQRYSDYGAADSEGFAVVEHILNKVYRHES